MNTENKNQSGVDDKTGKNTESPSKDSKDDTPSKPKRGEFHTRIVGTLRQRILGHSSTVAAQSAQ